MDGRLCRRQAMQASLQTTADEWAASRFWTHMEGRHTQGLDTTSLYLANTEHDEVEGQRFRGHGLVVWRGKKSIFEVSAQVLSGNYLVRMTYYLKEAS